jgi:uncharacterized lipoprotein YehR (DUF1307 family)
MEKMKRKINRNGSAFRISLIAVLCMGLAGIPACSGQEAQSENFNNNSTGADRDKTQIHKNDTLMIDNAEIRDSINKQ